MKAQIKWNFPYGKHLTPTGSNHASIETFRDNVLESLTREVLQNSLDAHDYDKEEPVHVSFDQITIKNTDIPDLNHLTDYAVPRANEYWEQNRDTLRYLDKFEKTIKSSTINVLKISDYNTTGLLQENFKSLVHADAYSEKRDDTAAGSKGIGKAAPFAASDLRLVFYSSFASDDISRSAGILNFVSFIPGNNEDELTQSRASYLDYDTKNQAIREQITFGHERRVADNYGTDLFVLGFKNFDEWAENIKLSTLENFIVSIFRGELSVSINDEVINQNNLDVVLSSINTDNLNQSDKRRVQSIKNYYDVLTSSDTKRFIFDERFKKYDFIEDLKDGILLIKEHEPANRRVLQTRQAGMKIYERTHISGTINFTGIFQAIGDKLNSYLRDIENPNHNDWSVDRIDQDNKEEKQQAESLLRDLFQWYKEKVKESFEEEVKEKVGAFGVADLLPILSDDEKKKEESNKDRDQGIKFKIKAVEKNKKKKETLPSGRVEDEEAELDRLAAELDKEGQEEEFDGREVGPEGGSSGEETEGEASGGKSTTGDLGEKGDGISRRVSYRKIPESKALKIKVIEEDASSGLYRLVGTHLSNHEQLALEFNYIDARGMKEGARLIDAITVDNSAIIENEKLILKNLKKNKSVDVIFQVDKNIRLKMRVDTYEIHS